jgi:hypothetical protein
MPAVTGVAAAAGAGSTSTRDGGATGVDAQADNNNAVAMARDGRTLNIRTTQSS